MLVYFWLPVPFKVGSVRMPFVHTVVSVSLGMSVLVCFSPQEQVRSAVPVVVRVGSVASDQSPHECAFISF